MTNLTKRERMVHSLFWLKLWDIAGRPVIDRSAYPADGIGGLPTLAFGIPGLVIEHTGTHRTVLHGRASMLRVAVAGQTVTERICPLIGARLSAGGLVAIRSGAGDMQDMLTLAGRIVRMHIDAAVLCRDLPALAKFDGPDVRAACRQIDEALLREALAASTSKAAGHRPLRV